MSGRNREHLVCWALNPRRVYFVLRLQRTGYYIYAKGTRPVSEVEACSINRQELQLQADAGPSTVLSYS